MKISTSTLAWVTAVFALSACGGGASGSKPKTPGAAGPPSSTNSFTVMANLSGLAEIPKSVVTDAAGTAELHLDTSSGVLEGTVTVSDIVATKVHLHAGYAGLAGDMVNALVPSSSADQWEVESGFSLSEEQQQAFVRGGFYINVHSNEFPDGALRGQLLADNLHAFTTRLTGDEVVEGPNQGPVTTIGSAVAGITVDLDTGSAWGQVQIKSIVANKVHFHQGERGGTGPVIFALEHDRTDLGTWRFAETATLTASQLELLTAGGTYFNVHTAVLPDGELRGQVEAE